MDLQFWGLWGGMFRGDEAVGGQLAGLDWVGGIVSGWQFSLYNIIYLWTFKAMWNPKQLHGTYAGL